MKKAAKNTTLKKVPGKHPFYAHLLSRQESQTVVAGMTLKFPSDKDETNRLSDL